MAVNIRVSLYVDTDPYSPPTPFHGLYHLDSVIQSNTTGCELFNVLYRVQYTTCRVPKRNQVPSSYS